MNKYAPLPASSLGQLVSQPGGSAAFHAALDEELARISLFLGLGD
jgi:hypothetical protein